MNQSEYLLGFDLGSSSVKATLLDADTGKAVASAQAPAQEMRIVSEKDDWAEQDPEMWWSYLCEASKRVLQTSGVKPEAVQAIGIGYQMHGLVLVDKSQRVLRPSIIWCDSRASDIGKQAFEALGEKRCLEQLLNSPGNFTASKLKWVQENEPELYSNIYKMMLPGDYISMKMTGTISTTYTGLSEGILWNYKQNQPARMLLGYYGIDEELIPEPKSSFCEHGRLTAGAAQALGLQKGVPVTFKAGDQPNNAFSLNVLGADTGAATAGTSGVIYGVSDKPVYDPKSRVNTFIHVNHTEQTPSYGVLLCINGTGILYRWIRENLIPGETPSYDKLNHLAQSTPIGADGIQILPFGNGSERILENRNPGARFFGIHFNRHDTGNILRAALEGIVFSMKYGFSIMKGMNITPGTIRAGHANLFLSPLFREAFANSTESLLELYETDGSEGAARGAGVGAGLYSDEKEAFAGLKKMGTEEPEPEKIELYDAAYRKWKEKLNEITL
ncbi:MAG: carbohydrate kinase [Balneolaceae bacterium]|nr:MAG: carbohydrate kinase [Balneolaceae bacterium]